MLTFCYLAADDSGCKATLDLGYFHPIFTPAPDWYILNLNSYY